MPLASAGQGGGGPRRDAEDVQPQRARLPRGPPPRRPAAVGLPGRHDTRTIRRGPPRRRRRIPLGKVTTRDEKNIHECVGCGLCVRACLRCCRLELVVVPLGGFLFALGVTWVRSCSRENRTVVERSNVYRVVSGLSLCEIGANAGRHSDSWRGERAKQFRREIDPPPSPSYPPLGLQPSLHECLLRT